MTDALDTLTEAVGHRFTDRSLATTAMVHRSYEAEHDVESYERLEFLGDAVLQLAVTDLLYARYPDLPEGELAKVRAAVVNETVLAGIGRDWGVPPALLLGRGEELTGGRDKASITWLALPSRNWRVCRTSRAYSSIVTRPTQGAVHRLIWYCRQGRLRLR